MQEKTAVGADLYIEDSPKNIATLRGEGQRTIVFTNSTNEDLAGPRADSWEEVVDLVLQEKAAWEGS
jgi:5'(3')-deoxyribonucleotidase